MGDAIQAYLPVDAPWQSDKPDKPAYAADFCVRRG
jgi:hypothetical protein